MSSSSSSSPKWHRRISEQDLERLARSHGHRVEDYQLSALLRDGVIPEFHQQAKRRTLIDNYAKQTNVQQQWRDYEALREHDRQLGRLENRFFKHPRINLKLKQFRVLTNIRWVRKRIWCDLEIRTTSRTPETRNAERYQYLALSHRWQYRSKHNIKLAGSSFYVEENVYAFLCEAANIPNSALPPIFIDSICIAQHTRDELNHQVGLMGEIYKNAKASIVWLGPQPDKLLASFDALRRCLEKRTYSLAYDSVPALRHMFSSEFWSRLWVVQEIILPKDVFIACGSLSLTFDQLVKTTSLIGTTVNFHDHAKKLNALYVEREKWQRGVYLPTKGLPLALAMDKFGGQQCSDIKDKVYGLLGLLNVQVTPNKQISPAEVYRKTLIVGLLQAKSKEEMKTINGCLLNALELNYGDPRVRREFAEALQQMGMPQSLVNELRP